MKLVKLITLVIALAPSYISYSQNSLAHLGSDIYQNNSFNPAFFPEGKWFFGMPALSGISGNFNSRIGYLDVIREQEDGSKQFVYNNLLSRLQRNNAIQLHLKVSTFHFGFRQNQAAISFFANERGELDFLFPKNIVDIIINGTENYLGQTINVKGIGLKARYYREIGFSYTYFSKNNRWSAGYRVKLLNGFYNASTLNSFEASLATSLQNLSVDFALRDAVLNTSGFYSPLTPSFFVNNKNFGIGLDMGFNYRVNAQLSLAASVNDIGFINWNESPRNYAVENTSFTYGGLELGTLNQVINSLEDSLGSQFQRRTTTDRFRDWNPVVANVSGQYRLTSKDEINAAISSRILFGKIKSTYSVGYKHRFGPMLAVNAGLVKMPHQVLSAGLSAVFDAGPFQLYVATDKPFGMEYRRIRYANASVGINFIFGRGVKKEKLDAPDNFRFLGGDQVKVKGREKLYLIIKKQNRGKALFDPEKRDESKLQNIKG